MTALRIPHRASSSTKADASAVLAFVGSIGTGTYAVLEPVCLERGLVDLDAEPRPGRWVEHPAVELAADRGDGRGEQALGREPVGESALLAAGLAQRRATCAAAAIPTGPSSALVT